MRNTVLINHLMEPPRKISGVSRYLFSLLADLSKRDRFNYLLATTWSNNDLPPSLRNSNIRVVTCDYVESLPRNLLAQLSIVRKLYATFECVAEFNGNPQGYFLPEWPRVITVHDLYMKTLPSLYPARHRLWWNLFFPMCARAATTVISVSNATRSELLKFYPYLSSKLAVVHEASALAVGKDLALKGEAPGAHGLFVGNISPNKNPGLLAEALAELRSRGAPVRIRHVGRDEVGLLAAALREHGVGDEVQSYGPLSDDALDKAYREARFLVVTSRQEGFCIPILEAQERGTPVICPDLPIFREVAGEGAYFFRPRDSNDLGSALVALSNDESLHARLSGQALCNARRFSWARAAEETENIISTAIQKWNGNQANEPSANG